MRRYLTSFGLLLLASPLHAADVYHQNYNPFGNAALSTFVAAIPILTLLYFIALHPHRDKQGHKHLGISAPWAAFFGVIAAFVVACAAFKMPFKSAVSRTVDCRCC
jgi:lactate permease